jgi:hypothetical protein
VRRWQCEAGGHSVTNTGPTSIALSSGVRRAEPGSARRDPPARRDQPWMETMRGMIKIATMFVILIIGLIAGPAVSL